MNQRWREFRLIKGAKVQVWKIRQEGESLITEHGLLDGKFQTFSDIPGAKGKEGTKAYVDAKANAAWNIEREIRKKTEHGYVELIDGKLIEERITEIDFNKCLPKNFTPLKPKSDIEPKALVKIHESGKARYSRKFDGMCYIACYHSWGWEIYSRRMDLASDKFPNHIEYLQSLPFDVGTILVGEMLCQRSDGTDDFKAVSRVCRSDPETARALVDSGEVSEPFYQVFEMLFHNGKDLKNTKYDDRRKLWSGISKKEIIRPVELHDVNPDNWEKAAKKNGWEGFVVVDGGSVPGDKFYSFDGDAKRPKGHHKLKPTYTEDIVIFAGTKGSGKRLNGIGAVFVKQRHPETGEWFNCGKCGSGFDDESLVELEELFIEANLSILDKDKDAEKLNLDEINGFVAEIEYGERQPGSNKFKFPVFMRVRYDKLPEECYAQRLAAEEE